MNWDWGRVLTPAATDPPLRGFKVVFACDVGGLTAFVRLRETGQATESHVGQCGYVIVQVKVNVTIGDT
jgi:hypothetical protein